MREPILNDGEAYVPGHSEEIARHLFDLAKKAGVDNSLVSTTSHGFIVPAEILVEKDEVIDQDDVVTAEDQTAEVDDADPAYDPSEHSVAEVKEYLDGADEAERQRVLDAEASSEKPRKGLLKEGDK